jgi:hypothetical protein
MDDATVRTQLEEIGFLATAEFELLDEDRDAPLTVIDRSVSTGTFEPATLKHDTSSVQRLVNESNHALEQLIGESIEVIERTKPPRIASEPVPLDDPEPGGPPASRRGLAVVAASLIAIALVAVGLAAALDDEPAAVRPPPKPSVARTPAVAPPPKAIEVKKAEPIVVDPTPMKTAAPAKLEQPKVEVPEPEDPPPAPALAEKKKPKKKKKELVEPELAEPRPILLDAALHEGDEEQIAQRSKKKRRERKPKPEKKKPAKQPERLLVGPDDL